MDDLRMDEPPMLSDDSPMEILLESSAWAYLGDANTGAVACPTLWEVLEGSSQDHGYDRPTWTQELMIAVLRDRTGITVSTSMMCR